jgi:hypothetical protein
LAGQIRHLILPHVGAQGPTVDEDDGLALAPILIEQARAITGLNIKESIFTSVVKFVLKWWLPQKPRSENQNAAVNNFRNPKYAKPANIATRKA